VAVSDAFMCSHWGRASCWTCLCGRTVAAQDFNFFTLCCLDGIVLAMDSLTIQQKMRRKNKVTFDERDEIIHKKAALAGYIGVWLYFVTACVVPWWLVGPKGTVSANILPIILIGGIIAFSIVQSLAILIQYGLGGKGETS